ncbi:MAG: choice-of-anchor E domain-containing protein [Gemmataceae bacterium]
MRISSILHAVVGRHGPRPQCLSSSKNRARLNLEPLEDRQLLSCATISGFVYYDVNNNGIMDAGEIGLANSQVQLKDSTGAVVATTVSDGQGFYKFDANQTVGTAPTTQTIQLHFDPSKTDWSQTQALAQFDPSLGQLTSVDIINNGSLTSQIKVESLDQAQATVIGTVSGTLSLTGCGISSLVTSTSSSQTFSAGAFDGNIDFGGASGHDFGNKTATGSKTVTLTSAADLAAFSGTGHISLTETAHATSNGSGAGNLMTLINSTASANLTVVYHYVPSNCLKPGRYTVLQMNQPGGYISGQVSQGGVVMNGAIATRAIPIDLTSSTGSGGVVVTPATAGNDETLTSTNNNFGEIKGASVAGFVYVDLNNNGIKEPVEPPIAAISIILTGLDDLGHSVQRNTTTGTDGSYAFGGLRPGNYTVTETQPANYLQGKNSVGSLGGSVQGDRFQVTIHSADAGVNYNFGELPAPVVVQTETPPPIPTPPFFSKRMYLASSFRLL